MKKSELDLYIYSIRHLHRLVFTYDGYTRIVEPHTLGIHKSTGNLLLRGHQILGDSSTGTLGWKLFNVDKIDFLAPVCGKAVFKPAPGYKWNDSSMSKIIAQIPRLWFIRWILGRL